MAPLNPRPWNPAARHFDDLRPSSARRLEAFFDTLFAKLDGAREPDSLGSFVGGSTEPVMISCALSRNLARVIVGGSEPRVVFPFPFPSFACSELRSVSIARSLTDSGIVWASSLFVTCLSLDPSRRELDGFVPVAALEQYGAGRRPFASFEATDSAPLP